MFPFPDKIKKKERAMKVATDTPPRHNAPMPKANDIQIGGAHYKTGGEEHWDRAWRLKYDTFQYIITKWVERWRKKGGIEDLKKARHALDKYIELAEAETLPVQDGSEPTSNYVNQDRGS